MTEGTTEFRAPRLPAIIGVVAFGIASFVLIALLSTPNPRIPADHALVRGLLWGLTIVCGLKWVEGLKQLIAPGLVIAIADEALLIGRHIGGPVRVPWAAVQAARTTEVVTALNAHQRPIRRAGIEIVVAPATRLPSAFNSFVRHRDERTITIEEAYFPGRSPEELANTIEARLGGHPRPMNDPSPERTRTTA